jgi:hypothetical protein
MKLLRHGYEADAVLVEGLHHLGKIQQRAAEPVDAVGHDTINLAGADGGQEAGQGRALQGAAAVAAVVIGLGQANPAGVLLAGDVGLGRFPLRVQGVELLLQAFLGGLPGVDGTANLRHRPRRRRLLVVPHDLAPFPLRRKNRKPLQCEPVMALATADSDG